MQIHAQIVLRVSDIHNILDVSFLIFWVFLPTLPWGLLPVFAYQRQAPLITFFYSLWKLYFDRHSQHWIKAQNLEALSSWESMGAEKAYSWLWMTMWGIQPPFQLLLPSTSMGPEILESVVKQAGRKTPQIKSPAFSISIENSHRLAPDTRMQDCCCQSEGWMNATPKYS